MFRHRVEVVLSLVIVLVAINLVPRQVIPVGAGATQGSPSARTLVADPAYLLPDDLLDRFPDPEGNAVSILAVSPVDGDGNVIVLAANTTSEPVTDLTATGTVTAEDGDVIDGMPYQSTPNVIPAGGIALLFVVFAGDGVMGAIPVLSLGHTPPVSPIAAQDLAVTEAEFVDDEVDGLVENTTRGRIQAINVRYACVGSNGELSTGDTTSGTVDLAPGESASFAMSVPPDTACSGAIITAIGVG